MDSKKMSTKTITMCGLMAAVCCILGPLSIPIGPVPISLTVVAVFLCVYVLGMVKGTIAYIVYLLLGAVGLPVFSNFEGGFQKIVGPTGGYLVGFIFMALISGFFIERFPVSKWYLHAVGMVLGLSVCYVLGTIYFMAITHMGLKESLGLCVIPFLPFDMVKIAVCIVVGCGLKTALHKANLIPVKE
jgi:biotin transport system substrate-specific component